MLTLPWMPLVGLLLTAADCFCLNIYLASISYVICGDPDCSYDLQDLLGGLTLTESYKTHQC